MKKNILVTGSKGFIGRKLVDKLIKEGFNVFTHDSLQGDIATCDMEYEDIHHVFHLAAMTYIPKSWENTLEFYRVNIMGTANILEFCKKSKCSLTFMSTYVYGIPNSVPTSEMHKLQPNTPYNHSKILSESLCEFYNDTFNIDITILRPFNIYGEGQSEQFLIPTLIKQFLNTDNVYVEVMSLEPKRDYVYVDDVIDAMCMTIDNRGYEIYNLGSGESKSVLEIILTIKNVLNSDKGYRCKNMPRKGEILDIRADISKIYRKLGWMPKYNLEEGIRKLLEVEEIRLK